MDNKAQGSPRLLWLLIVIPIIGIIAGVYGVWWAQLSDVYDVNIDEANLSGYDKLDEIRTDIDAIKDKTSQIDEDPSITDRLGTFLFNGYSILITIPKSLNMILAFMSDGMTTLSENVLGESGYIIFAGISVMFTIIIFVGIILAILLKKTRL